jgi:hypothetical protein
VLIIKSKKDKQHNGRKTKGQTMVYKIILRKLIIDRNVLAVLLAPGKWSALGSLPAQPLP